MSGTDDITHGGAGSRQEQVDRAEDERYLRDAGWSEERIRQAWVNGDDPMCEDVCVVQCKGPCGAGESS
jgi:hypothetical protein